MSTDPVLERRARIARGVGLAKRLGYFALLAAMVCFAIAAGTGFPGALVTVTIVALVAACVVLPVPIILGYGLRAAEREERQERHARERARLQSGGDQPGPRR